MMEALRISSIFHKPKIEAFKRLLYLKVMRKFVTKPKVTVALDESVSLDINPKKHPGVTKIPAVEVPPRLVSAILSVIKDQPLTALLNEADILRRYLHSRQAPVESKELNFKTSEFSRLVENEDGININALGDEERVFVQNVRELKVHKLLGERLYRWKAIDYDDYKSIVYLIARCASNYAVMLKVFHELKLRVPAFSPNTFFDFGSGVGTGIWAVKNSWRTVKEYFCVDSSSSMNELADLLLRDGDVGKEHPFTGIFFRQFLPSTQTLKYDLVLSAFSLLDLPSSQNRLQTVMNLWNKTSGYLVLIEDGTMSGSKVINEARDFILEFSTKSENSQHAAAHVVAPCPHDLQCPKVKTRKPCTFIAPYMTLPIGVNQESRRKLFSYVILRKGPRPENDVEWPRLVEPALVKSKHTICRMCCPDGTLKEVTFTASRHGKFAYHCARASKWGDLLPVKISENTSEE